GAPAAIDDRLLFDHQGHAPFPADHFRPGQADPGKPISQEAAARPARRNPDPRRQERHRISEMAEPEGDYLWGDPPSELTPLPLPRGGRRKAPSEGLLQTRYLPKAPPPALSPKGAGVRVPYARTATYLPIRSWRDRQTLDLIDMPLSLSEPTWSPIASSEDLPFRHVYQ